MKCVLRHSFTGLFCAALGLSVLSSAHAQRRYTFFPNDTTVNYGVSTDTNVVGYAGGDINHFLSPSSPTVNFVTGSNIGGELDVYNHSTLNISSDVESIVYGMDNSTINVTQGNVYALVGAKNSAVNFSGGSSSDLEAWDTGQVNITGGHYDFLGILDSGTLNIRGGQFDALEIDNMGTANFYGTHLGAALLDPNYNGLASLYALSGTLSDGTLLDKANFVVDDRNGASFHLFNAAAVPEPGSVALLFGIVVSGGIFALRRHARSKQAVL